MSKFSWVISEDSLAEEMFGFYYIYFSNFIIEAGDRVPLAHIMFGNEPRFDFNMIYSKSSTILIAHKYFSYFQLWCDWNTDKSFWNLYHKIWKSECRTEIETIKISITAICTTITTIIIAINDYMKKGTLHCVKYFRNWTKMFWLWWHI